MTLVDERSADMLAELRAHLSGDVIGREDAEYDAARRIWNGMIDRHPAAIACCVGVSDVIEAVNYARTHQLPIAIRGGSHSAAGLSMCDDGVVVDLTRMRGIRVDPSARTAQVQAGALWADLDRETQVFGLATTGGTVSNTGVSGLTLGGGLGWLAGVHGLACDNLVSVDLVTAEGKSIVASENDYPDLFWALRGGGGNFGVATSFTFNLHEVGPLVLGGLVIHPFSEARAVLNYYREFCQGLPDAAEAYVAILSTPDGQRVIALILGYNGDLSEGERVLAPARQFGSPIADLVQPIPYVQRQKLLDDLGVHGLHRYWKSGFIPEISDEFLDVVVEHAQTILSPLAVVPIFYLHGVSGRVDPQATAYGVRGEYWDFDVISQWTDPAESAVHVQWTRQFWQAVDKYSSGVYVNHLADDEPQRLTAAFGPNYDRLVEVKTKYDPDNLFHVNHNIRPRA